MDISSRLWRVHSWQLRASCLPVLNQGYLDDTATQTYAKVTLLTILRERSTSNQKIQWFDQAVHTRQDCDGLLTHTTQEEEEAIDVSSAYSLQA